MTSPIDQDIRDRAANEIQSSLALTAGAGSGKTSVLVARVLQLLTAGKNPSRLAAITFTEKAAGELELRIRQGLEEALADPESSDAVLDAIRRLSEMQISTIHSFCQTLLVEEALEAAWNPDAELVDAAFSAEATNLAFDDWWRTFERDHPHVGLLIHEIVSDHSIRGLAAMCMEYRDLEPVAESKPPDWSSLDDQLRGVHQDILKRAEVCTAPDDKLLGANARLLTVLSHAATRPTPIERVSFVLATKEEGKASKSFGRAGDWGGTDNKLAFVDAVGAFQAWCVGVRQQLHGLVVTHLRENFVRPALALKSRAGEYDYSDLLFQSARLLAERPDARTRLASRYDAILVDEVQDTDPIQAEVAMLLSRPADLEGAWDDHPPRPGALFAVGDPKQSIYRFRRADVRTWRALRDAIAGEGQALSLSTNFRSVPGIVRWVNEAFSQLPGYEPQEPFRAAAELDPVVLVEPGDLTSAECIVRYLKNLERERARVSDRHTDELRKLKWGDVMVLLPSWGAAARIQSALQRAGIDAIVEGGKTFFGRDEVRLLLAAMRSLEEPADGESTVFVLRGLFGFDHQTLLDFTLNDGTWRYTVRNQPSGAVADALEILRSLHFRRDRQSWVKTLEELLDECWAPAVWSGMLDGKARLANVAKFYSLIREAERTSPTSGATLAAMEDLSKQDDKRELPVVDFDSDAVRITTYFSAKGLESPVVVLAHSKRSVSIGSFGAEASINREERTVALRVSGLDPAGWPALRQLEVAEAAEEQRRWMYVGATRPRDQLVIVRQPREKLLDYDIEPNGLPPQEERGGHGATVAVGDAEVTVLQAEQLPEAARHDAVFPSFGDVQSLLDAGTLTTHSRLLSREDKLRDAIGRSKRKSTTWRSVGQLVKKSRRARKYEEGVGAAGGTVVHLVMANLDLAQPTEVLQGELPALLDSFAASEGLDPETRDKCFTILENMLRHPVVARARVAPERWIEAPFTFKEGHRIVSGIIDLCFPVDAKRERWVVVDWKSNLPPEGTPERASYEAQLAYYAKALIANVTPCTDVETVLVGPHPELLAPDELTEALELVDEDLAEVLTKLVEAGVPIPEIGLDVGEPIVGMLELAWPDRRFGVGVDLTLVEATDMREQGWKLLMVETSDPHWTETVYRRVAAHFGAEVEADDETGQEAAVDPIQPPPKPPKAAIVPVEESALRGTRGVVQVHEAKRIAYAEDLPREEMLKLVAQGWMVVEFDEAEHGLAPPSEADDFPFTEREILTAWALRFDGYNFIDETRFQVPQDAVERFETGDWPYSPLEELAILFVQQRFLCKWGGEQLPVDGAEWQFFRALFLRVASYDVPEEWRAAGYEQWDRIYRRKTAEIVEFIEGRTARLGAEG